MNKTKTKQKQGIIYKISSFYKNSLRNQILIPFIILILFTGGVISFVSFNFSVKNTTEELSENVEGQMVNLNDTFEIFFSNISNTLERYTSNELLIHYKTKNKAKVMKYLQETQETNGAITLLYTGIEKTGEFIDFPDRDQGEDYNPKERSWYKDAVAAEGEIVWTEPYESASTGKPVITASKAYYNGDKLVGVMAADVFIDTLIDMVNKIEIGETGYAVIYDKNGKWITHPEKEKIGRDESQTSYYQEMVEIGNQGIVEYNVDGKEFTMGFVKNPTTDWYLLGAANKVDFKKQAQAIFIPIAITLIIVTLIAIVVTLWITGKVTKAIKTVMERMKLIANGDLSHPPLEIKSKDEVGHLVQATNGMNEHMRHLLHQINTVAETVSSQSEELTQSAGEVKSGSEQVASTMQELASGSETQAHSTGDLSANMQSFANEIEDLSENGDQIKQFSNEIIGATAEGSQLMDASKEQMEIIDEIVHDAVKKVEGLDVQSQEISKLVNVIQDVADQTNLLALNAAIEAARAGEHGKGFAVVADEVRKLAEQVSDSVTDITGIVTKIQQESSLVANTLQNGYHEVEQGSTQIETTGGKFSDINTSILEMGKSIDSVVDNLTSISARSQEMNRSIEDIAAISEESAAGIEETSASSEQTTASMEEVAQSSRGLAKLAEELNELVLKFKL